MAAHNPQVALSPNRAMFKMTAIILLSWALVGAFIFVTAGRLDWGWGWLFFAFWGVLKLVFIVLLRILGPDLMVERATRHTNVQPYDRVIIPAYFAFAFGAILLGGLDGGRFRWSGDVPVSIIIASYLLYLLCNCLASWAAASNPFFSSESRLQTDRDQHVSRAGPYRYMRHPAYLAAIVMWLTTGLLLESWWAVIPGVLAALMMLIRTSYEDQMLVLELPGYADYAKGVCYRLLPGVW